MIIIPAIDILGGVCVRLMRGEYGSAHKVAADPLETALGFAAAGAKYIHMVDLDGAKAGSAQNREVFISVAASACVPVELGGGIRDMKTVEYYLKNGIKRVILGTAALSDPSFVSCAVNEYGDAVAVGIDARGGKVSVSGWTEDSDVDYIEFAKKMEDIGVKNIIYTDISRDGMKTGPDFDGLAALSAAVSCDITASGGIANIDDIIALRDMNLYAAIAGKAIYSGSLDLTQAVAVL